MTIVAWARKILELPLFSRREEVSRVVDILKWWEVRRLAYNLALGAAGVLTIAVLLVISRMSLTLFHERLPLFDPPTYAIIGAFFYALGANVCYSGGWIAELIVRKIWAERSGAFAQISFSLGLTFSIILTLAPAGLLLILFVVRLVSR